MEGTGCEVMPQIRKENVEILGGASWGQNQKWAHGRRCLGGGVATEGCEKDRKLGLSNLEDGARDLRWGCSTGAGKLIGKRGCLKTKPE